MRCRKGWTWWKCDSDEGVEQAKGERRKEEERQRQRPRTLVFERDGIRPSCCESVCRKGLERML